MKSFMPWIEKELIVAVDQLIYNKNQLWGNIIFMAKQKHHVYIHIYNLIR